MLTIRYRDVDLKLTTNVTSIFSSIVISFDGRECFCRYQPSIKARRGRRNNRWCIRAATSAGNLKVWVVRRGATVCRFAQCTGCENSRNAVHTVSWWVATRYVCYFVAFLLSLRRVFLFSVLRFLLWPRLFSRRLHRRNDIHPVRI